MVFEYGPKIKKPLKKEKYIWIMIEHIVDAMIFLEELGLHYPSLRLAYVMRKEYKFFKLLNPYAFPFFLKEVLKVYTNPLIPITKRKKYRECNQKRNIFELGILVLNSIGDFDEEKLYLNFEYLKSTLMEIYHLISSQLREFFKFIFDETTTPENFQEIKNWLVQNMERFKSKYMINYYHRKKKEKCKKQFNTAQALTTPVPLQVRPIKKINIDLREFYKDEIKFSTIKMENSESKNISSLHTNSIQSNNSRKNDLRQSIDDFSRNKQYRVIKIKHKHSEPIKNVQVN